MIPLQVQLVQKSLQKAKQILQRKQNQRNQQVMGNIHCPRSIFDTEYTFEMCFDFNMNFIIIIIILLLLFFIIGNMRANNCLSNPIFISSCVTIRLFISSM